MQHFIVFGVPRSGTTALADLLNSHPNVFCGRERFSIEGASEKIFNEACIADRSIPNLFHYEHNLAVLKEKINLKAIGDKIPLYYINMNSIQEKFTNLKNISILRRMEDVFCSWNTRANNKNDVSWRRDQYGILSFFNYLSLLKMLAQKNYALDYFVLGYETLLIENNYNTKRVLDELFSYLGVEASPEVIKYFNDHSAYRESIAQAKREISSQEEKFINQFELNTLFDYVNQTGFLRFTDVQPVAEEIQTKLWNSSEDWLNEAAKIMLGYQQNKGIEYAILMQKQAYSLDKDNIYRAIHKKHKDKVDNKFVSISDMLINIEDNNYSDALKQAIKLNHIYPDSPLLQNEITYINNCLCTR